jgi:NAD(P)-dependent dehydrogenase (short-subunit alcohol dehydrogenase family)
MYMEKLRLDGRVAVVVGGGRNIGLACGQALAEAGATVVVADLSAELAAEGAAAITAAGGKADSLVIDVTDTRTVEAAVTAVQDRHGRIDVLVCNAGIAISETPAETSTDAHWLKHIDINLNGVFRCCRGFGRVMLAAGRGSIVNVGSMSGFIVNKPQEQAAYNASKAGVHHLTRSLAAEWAARGVRVNAVAPTYIETSLTRFGMDNPKLYPHWIAGTPMGRVGQPDEIGSVEQFLASEAASLMTGAIVNVDGGYTLW